MHMQVVHNAYTPKETTELCSRAGTMKGNMRADKVFVSSFVAGCLLAFACACTLSVSVSPWFQENAPGVVALLGAIIFPWGLVAILSTGTDLCTGSFMVSVFHRSEVSSKIACS
jgi:formate/nitrite transporter FocA (FNT family)